MQLINEPQVTQETKTKKIILITLIISIVLFFVVLIAMLIMSSMKPKVLKCNIDDTAITIPEDMFLFKGEQQNEVYVSLKDIASFIGYRYFNGEYQKYTETSENCYLQNNNEVVSFKLGSKEIKKTVELGKTDYYTYMLNNPIEIYNNELYINMNDLRKSCNVEVGYDVEKNNITIFTLNYLSNYYKNIAITNYSYTNISEEYNNKKAILNNMLVVQNNNQYGVIDLNGNTIIGTKYDKIEYIEISEEFLVTSSNKVGMLSKNGDTKIRLEYSEIKLLDNDAKLYYVKNANNLKGVLDRNGKVIIYSEYDEIGINASLFPNDDIRNSMLLFDNCIPVKKNGRWGLYNVSGKLLHNTDFDSLGCVITTSKNKTTNNTLFIPSVEGIVVCKNGKYGIVKSTGEYVAPISFNKIYSETSEGKDTYYLDFEGQIINLKDYFKKAGIITIPEEDEKEEQNTGLNEVEIQENNQNTINNNVSSNNIVQTTNEINLENTLNQNVVNAV